MTPSHIPSLTWASVSVMQTQVYFFVIDLTNEDSSDDDKEL